MLSSGGMKESTLVYWTGVPAAFASLLFASLFAALRVLAMLYAVFVGVALPLVGLARTSVRKPEKSRSACSCSCHRSHWKAENARLSGPMVARTRFPVHTRLLQRQRSSSRLCPNSHKLRMLEPTMLYRLDLIRELLKQLLSEEDCAE